MAWSVRFLGKAGAIRSALQAKRGTLEVSDVGQFDAIMPHVLALVQANTGVELLDVRVTVTAQSCSVALASTGANYVE